jgi:ribosomal protein S18 acetylase RimI-like enzyme
MAWILRPAESADSGALGRMGAALARQHHAFDPERFMLPANVEEGYRAWLARELAQKDAIVLVAVEGAAVVGYAYGRIEERDWNALRDRCGGFHDLWVEPQARGSGAGSALAQELLRRFEALGVPRVVLSTAAKNEPAQRLFARLGWRPTMVEMTREVPARSR